MSDRLPPWQSWACRQLGARTVSHVTPLQSLWSGYGQILKLTLDGGSLTSAVLKRIAPPSNHQHPRGWNSNLSHQRKLRSYEIESRWYQQWSSRCGPSCRIPRCFGQQSIDGEQWLLLEDLDAAGFARRSERLSPAGIDACLAWLASFHARFLGTQPEGLWPVGTYWHLDTRPDELAAMEDDALRQAAPAIDSLLSGARFQTLVHGDAKVANFCFSSDLSAVAAVDFQYVGGGCGMKDVAYFMGSCLSETECEQQEQRLLDSYFHYLLEAVPRHHFDTDLIALETEWRALFPLAWTDFHRFMLGWMPGHWKVNRFSRRLAADVLATL